jgi:hypothetical protein
MPWSAEDATSHTKKADTPEKKKAWAKAANAALKTYDGDEGKAIATANATVDKMSDGDRTDETDGGEKRVYNTLEGLDVMVRDGVMKLAAPSSFDPKSREAEAIISTGMRVRRHDWMGGEYDEVLDMSPGAVRLARLNQGAALLDSHNYHQGIGAMLGGIVPGSARLEGGKLLARVKFSQHSDIARRVAGDLKDGIQFPLSAGYKVHKYIEDMTTSPTTRMITDWEPVEVSLVTVAAEQTGTGIRGEIHRRSSAQQKERQTMKKSVRNSGESDSDFLTRIADYFREHEPVDGETAEQLAKRSNDYLAAVKRQEDEDKKTRQDDKSKAKKEDDDEDDKKKKKAAADKEKEDRGHANNGNQIAAEILAIGRQANMPMEDIERALRENVTAEQFRTRAFEHLVAVSKRGAISGAQGGGSDDSGGVSGDSFDVGVDRALTGRAAAMAEAMKIRMLASRRVPGIFDAVQKERVEMRGITDQVVQSWRIYDGKEQPADPRVRQFLGLSFVDMAAEIIGYRSNRLLTAQRAGDILTRAMQSTSDYQGIFLNALNKTLLARYQLAMPTYREISVERPFNDFRPHPQIRAGDFPLPQPLTETGELRVGASQDSKETVSVLPYGIIFRISRQMLVNDDLGAIDQILGQSGEGVLRFENITFYAMFNSNPVLQQDALAVFTAGNITIPPAAAVGHNNYAPSFAQGGNVPSIATIGAARQALRQMRSLSGFYLNVPPKIMLTGPSQETIADQMVTQIAPTLTTSVNPFSGRLRNITDAYVTTPDWFIFCEPASLPCFIYGFLAGSSGPRIRTEEPFGVQGINMSLEHDFGVGAIDYRGVYRNCGLTS